jgi:hypothetical protein
LSEKKVANIGESDLPEASDGSCESGLRSMRVLVVFQVLRGLAEHEETMQRSVEAFLSICYCGMIFICSRAK